MLARGSPEARQADRVLRRQSHHDRWIDRARFLRQHHEALRVVRLARTTDRGRQRSQGDRFGYRPSEAGDRAAIADHRADAHRLGQPAQAGHRRRAWRAAGHRRGESDEAEPRLAFPRAVLRSGRRARAVAERQDPRRAARGRLEEEEVGHLPRGPSRSSRRAGAPPRRPPAGGLGCGIARLRSERCASHARGIGQGAQCDRDQASGVDGRISRSDRLKQHRDQRGRTGPELPLRRPRARDGRGTERHHPTPRVHPIWWHLPDLLRLHAAVDTAGCADAPQADLRLHTRLDRPGRRWADASAHRAARRAARDSQHDRHPPVGCDRGGRGVARGDHTPQRTGGAGPHSAKGRGGGRTKYAPAAGLHRGGYVLADSPNPDIVLMATGSEVELILGAYERLKAEGRRPRAVSMPCLEYFAKQAVEHRNSVLPPGVPRIAVEAAAQQSWYRWVGDNGVIMGIERFGESAPYQRIYKEFGLTVDDVVAEARTLV